MLTVPVPYGGMLRRGVCPSRKAGAVCRVLRPGTLFRSNAYASRSGRKNQRVRCQLRCPMPIAPPEVLTGR